MKLKNIGILIIVVLLTISFSEATNTNNTLSILGEKDDFTQWFENPTGQNDMEGKDFTAADGSEGHIQRVTDTKDPPTEEMDICDNVVILWKKPSMKKPWVTYHIDDMSPTGGHGWYFHFDYKSSNSKDPGTMAEPPGGFPPNRGRDRRRHHYVDDNNIAGPWDGTYDHPYNRIQDGIDAASEGDVVRVFPGKYYENLVINTDNIGLTAETFEPVLIEGSGIGSVTLVIANYVTITGDISISKSGTSEEDAGLDIRGKNIYLAGVSIENCQNGIYLHESASNNVLFENTIQDNVWGLFIMHDCNNNTIYHNNFISNTGFHVKAYSDNQWESDFYNGNYWDDYTGTDADGDGIGDTPYPVQGGTGQDNKPLMNPWSNQAPEKPIIDGPASGNTQQIYGYTVQSAEPDDHDMIYEIDWGDGNKEYTPFYTPSDEPQTINHSWETEGTYTIQVRSIDYYGAESDWSDSLSISMPKTKTIFNPFLRFLENHPRLFPLLRLILT
jgi:parallel beta-helix repeat protein